MEYLNEDNFKDLDNFIEQCTETGAAIGDLNTVLESIDGTYAIPIRSSTVYVGELHSTGNDIQYYEQCIAQGIELNEEEYAHYQELLKDSENN
jgi:hypothetical protein